MSKRDWQLFDSVLMWTRAFFAVSRPEDMHAAGTREMVYRYVVKKVGQDVPHSYVSAALKILKDGSEIIFENRVWWSHVIR